MLIEYTQSLLRLARRAVLYHVRDTRPRLVLLPVLDEWDEACGADVGPEDLDAGGWIPHHRTTISAVDYFPERRLTSPMDTTSSACKPRQQLAVRARVRLTTLSTSYSLWSGQVTWS